jgi:hypothetical protein
VIDGSVITHFDIQQLVMAEAEVNQSKKSPTRSGAVSIEVDIKIGIRLYSKYPQRASKSPKFQS